MKAGTLGDAPRPAARATTATTCIAAALAACALAGTASADRLVTEDGRVLTVKKARKTDSGDYHLVFEHGELVCPAGQVASVEIEGDMSDYVPQNDDERRKLEDGYVRYQGRWMSKVAYEAQLAKEAQARSERVAELALHSDWFNAYEKETKHFVIKTNTSQELCDYYADLMEAYYDLMDKRVGISPTPTLRRTKMTVNVYKSLSEFHDLGGTGGGVLGYFSFFDETLNFYHDYADPATSDWVALHECTHLLTYLIEPQSRPRIWVNEGVADFFGSSDITRDKRGKLEITPGKLQVDRILTVQQAIKDGDYVPLEKLFTTDRGSFQGFEYAHSWSFIYFLNNSNAKYEKGFKKFFKEHYTIPKSVEYEWESFPNKQGTAKVIPAKEVRRLLLDCLKVDDVAELEKEWLEFIQGIEIDAPEARFKRGYRVVRSFDADQFDSALVDLNAAIEAGVDDPRAYAARGQIKAWKGGIQAGRPDFRKAIELSPLDAGFHYSLAQSLAGSGVAFVGGEFRVTFSGDRELRGTDQDLDEAKRHYGLAMELAPDNDWYRESYAEYMEAYERHKASGD